MKKQTQRLRNISNKYTNKKYRDGLYPRLHTTKNTPEINALIKRYKGVKQRFNSIKKRFKKNNVELLKNELDRAGSVNNLRESPEIKRRKVNLDENARLLKNELNLASSVNNLRESRRFKDSLKLLNHELNLASPVNTDLIEELKKREDLQRSRKKVLMNAKKKRTRKSPEINFSNLEKKYKRTKQRFDILNPGFNIINPKMDQNFELLKNEMNKTRPVNTNLLEEIKIHEALEKEKEKNKDLNTNLLEEIKIHEALEKKNPINPKKRITPKPKHIRRVITKGNIPRVKGIKI